MPLVFTPLTLAAVLLRLNRLVFNVPTPYMLPAEVSTMSVRPSAARVKAALPVSAMLLL